MYDERVTEQRTRSTSEKPSTMRSLLISTCQLGKNHLLHNGGQQSNINIVLLLFSFFTAIEQQRLKPQHIFKVTAFCLKHILKKKFFQAFKTMSTSTFSHVRVTLQLEQASKTYKKYLKYHFQIRQKGTEP